MMDAVIDQCAEHGLDEVVVGMPHRGRLNVLVRWGTSMPSSRAKVAKARVMAAVLTVGSRHHQRRPVLGRTKPYT